MEGRKRSSPRGQINLILYLLLGHGHLPSSIRRVRPGGRGVHWGGVSELILVASWGIYTVALSITSWDTCTVALSDDSVEWGRGMQSVRRIPILTPEACLTYDYWNRYQYGFVVDARVDETFLNIQGTYWWQFHLYLLQSWRIHYLNFFLRYFIISKPMYVTCT